LAEFDHKHFLSTLTHRPGVYRMLNEDGETLYVGKARDLRKRVASYFGKKAVHPKTQALMGMTANVEVIVTATEHEALLLEYNLIKEHKPRFNVMLRDDKSYPYIHVTTDERFPRFAFHRGTRGRSGKYFGPFPSAGAVRQTMQQLQKLFMVRQCEDSYFSNRSRPCLQHQIGRCTAPCVGLIESADYRNDVNDAIMFLEGRNDRVLDQLTRRMDACSANLEFERAARYRDQVAAIKRVQATQAVSGLRSRNVDVLAVSGEQTEFCVALILIRGGRILGSRHFYPKVSTVSDEVEVLTAFVAQHYFVQDAPPEVLLSVEVEAQPVLAAALGERAGHKVALKHRVRAERKRWLEMAAVNAREGLSRRRTDKTTVAGQFAALSRELELEQAPTRIECFDVSHTAGELTVASCVVFNVDGPVKADYRRFNIRDIEPGDDYAAMEQVLSRRYQRRKKEGASLPDLIMVDGGQGQLLRARRALEEMGLGHILLVAVAKGFGRRPGLETLYTGRPTIAVALDPSGAGMRLVLSIRDEAHRFAITGHRQRRKQARQRSVLEDIPGLGPKRRRALLRHFGGLQGVRRAGVEDLGKVAGISTQLAKLIYRHLHDRGTG
jgi:excinuclease ABC subunit C